MRRDLELDASPPLGAPLRFFLNAPVFASIAAALLLYAGPAGFASRWSPFALAATHALTLGAFASVMMGALIQILPVVAGAQIAWVRTSAVGIHALLTLGTLLLIAAFVGADSALFPFAGSLCAAAAAWFALACAIGLGRRSSARTRGTTDIVRAVRLALTALLVTVGLGAMLALSLWRPLSLPVVALTNLHLAWGLAGWIGLLTAGVAYQVIPMFQVTEPYPRVLMRAFAPLSFCTLVLVTLGSLGLPTHGPIAAVALHGALFALYCGFAVVTLALLHRRKRPSPDATTLFWRTSMTSLICAVPAWVIGTVAARPSSGVMVGVLLLAGGVWSAISGMLYKIIPFLLWYHMQASIDVRSSIVPKVKAVLPDTSARAQYWAHLIALLLLLAAAASPVWLSRPAALAFVVSNVWLGVNIASAVRVYVRVVRKLASVRASSLEL
ncbi:MAG: hypothetical protein KGQ57_02190 [Burkholderiales bacterium]|nr:hypothetical protein [Burkholderiales bacterium]